MASFNLGKIKGDKGEKGDIGPKGEKGEKGDRGERGTDGFTPVFSVAQAQSLPYDSEPYVELDSSDAQNPVLKFYIPRGKDGLDASGDMQSAQYDKNQRKTDIYEYADNLAEASFKKEGGAFIGQVKAYVSEPEDACVRNVSVAGALPINAKNGDVCILTKKKSDITLKDIEPGSTVLIKENGVLREYIVFSNNTRYSGKVELIRNNLLNDSVSYNKSNIKAYSQTDIDVFLNSVFINSLDERVRNKLCEVQVENNLSRRIFLASREEISGFASFKDNSFKAQTDSGNGGVYWTRTPAGEITVYCYNIEGESTILTANEKYYVRPVIVLPCDTCVENSDTGSGMGFKISEDKGGIYIFKNGEWSECEL